MQTSEGIQNQSFLFYTAPFDGFWLQLAHVTFDLGQF